MAGQRLCAVKKSDRDAGSGTVTLKDNSAEKTLKTSVGTITLKENTAKKAQNAGWHHHGTVTPCHTTSRYITSQDNTER